MSLIEFVFIDMLKFMSSLLSDTDTDKSGVADQNSQVPTKSSTPVTSETEVSQCTTITTQADITPISSSADTPGKYSDSFCSLFVNFWFFFSIFLGKAG